jgi:hypothetical protein
VSVQERSELDEKMQRRETRRSSAQVLSESISPTRAAGWVVVLILLAAAVHIWLIDAVPAPWVFFDELAYQKLAQSIESTGRLALLGKQGLSYSPLYPLLISPLYGLGLSGPSVYRGILVVNCLLFAAAGIPIYAIARFALSPGRAVAATGLSLLAPLMLFSSLVMSENLAYPVFLFAVWAMLATVARPSRRADGVVIVLCGLCAVARLQFIVLLPAALLAVALVTLFEPRSLHLGIRRFLARVFGRHLLLTLANLLLVLAGIVAYLGSSIVSLAGQYANQRALPTPTPWPILKLAVQNVAGLELAIGVIPVVGSLVAATIWYRQRGDRMPRDAFAAVAIANVVVVTGATAFAAWGQLHPAGGDLPRIHERYLIYLVPLFVIGMMATLGLPRSSALLRTSALAATVGALLPLTIPFHSVINHTIGADSFGLFPYAMDNKKGVLVAVTHATLTALFVSVCLGGIYALARPRLGIVVAVLAVVFGAVSLTARTDQLNTAMSATKSAFSGHPDWVDRAVGDNRVVVVENPHLVRRGLGVAETAFFNLSISELVYPCKPLLSSEFGEEHVLIGAGGRLLVDGAPIRGTYVVVPADSGVQGRVVASDRRAKLVVVEPKDGIAEVSKSSRALWGCTRVRPAGKPPQPPAAA